MSSSYGQNNYYAEYGGENWGLEEDWGLDAYMGGGSTDAYMGGGITTPEGELVYPQQDGTYTSEPPPGTPPPQTPPYGNPPPTSPPPATEGQAPGGGSTAAMQYLQQNPDIMEEAQRQLRDQGIPLEQFAQQHWDQYGQAEGRGWPSGSDGGAVANPGPSGSDGGAVANPGPPPEAPPDFVTPGSEYQQTVLPEADYGQPNLPGLGFDAMKYLQQNPDVMEEAQRQATDQGIPVEQFAQQHWNEYGQAEGRSGGGLVPPEFHGPTAAPQLSNYEAGTPMYGDLNLPGAPTGFNAQSYLEQNPDVMAEAQRQAQDQGIPLHEFAQQHWNQYGQGEGRSGSGTGAEALPAIPGGPALPDVYGRADLPDSIAAPTYSGVGVDAPEFQQSDVSMEAFKGSPQYQVMMENMERAQRATTAGAAARGFRNDPRMQLELQRRSQGVALGGYSDFYEQQTGLTGEANKNAGNLYEAQMDISREGYDREVGQYGADRLAYGDARNNALARYEMDADIYGANRANAMTQYDAGQTAYQQQYDQQQEMYNRGQTLYEQQYGAATDQYEAGQQRYADMTEAERYAYETNRDVQAAQYDMDRQHWTDANYTKQNQYAIDRQYYGDQYAAAMDRYNLDRQQYGDDYNRVIDQYNMDRGEYEDYYAKLAGVAGVGYGATTYMGNLGMNMASNIGNANMGAAAGYGNAVYAAGQANAAGTMGMADAVGQGMMNAALYWPGPSTTRPGPSTTQPTYGDYSGGYNPGTPMAGGTYYGYN